MIRKCFICNNEVSGTASTWNIPGISEPKKIGFGYCEKCSLVIQTPTIRQEEMFQYYKSTATYINPGREGKPSKNKIIDVKRQLDFLSSIVDCTNLANAFQIGCSDGYTLSQIKNKITSEVKGIDPSSQSNKLAKKLYNINTIVGVFENFIPNEKYDLIILTHILEHLYNPHEILKKCNTMLNKNGYILFEVPLFENHNNFPPGMFTLEHLNYFTERSLRKLFLLNNLEILALEKLYYNDLYPIITMILRKNIHSENFEQNFKDTFEQYTDNEQESWAKVEKIVLKSTNTNEEVYIWGGGIHTTQLLANTNLLTNLNVLGILDFSETKHGKNLGNFIISKPTKDIIENKTIIISSFASEKEIANYIKTHFNYKKIILLYEGKEL